MKKTFFYSFCLVALMGFTSSEQNFELDLDLDLGTEYKINSEALFPEISQSNVGYAQIECEIEPIDASLLPWPRRWPHHSQGDSDVSRETKSTQFNVGTPSTYAHIPLEQGTSLNWSGYAVASTQNTVTSVIGTWTVPTLKATPDNSYTALWVGIDGYTSSTVEQIGTAHNWIHGQNNQQFQQNYAWFEMYPGGAYSFNFPVSPGDSITCSVNYISGTTFQLQITNNTKRVYAIIPTSYTKLAGAKRSSAEWIAEAPTGINGVVPLSNFNTVTFSNCGATISGKTGPINNSRYWQGTPITMMTNTSVVKAIPSSLNSAGNGFSDIWKHE